MDSVLTLESEINVPHANGSDIRTIIYKNNFAIVDFQEGQTLVQIYNTNYDQNELIDSFRITSAFVFSKYNKNLIMNEKYIIIYIRPETVFIINLESQEHKLFKFGYEETTGRRNTRDRNTGSFISKIVLNNDLFYISIVDDRANALRIYSVDISTLESTLLYNRDNMSEIMYYDNEFGLVFQIDIDMEDEDMEDEDMEDEDYGLGVKFMNPNGDNLLTITNFMEEMENMEVVGNNMVLFNIALRKILYTNLGSDMIVDYEDLHQLRFVDRNGIIIPDNDLEYAYNDLAETIIWTVEHLEDTDIYRKFRQIKNTKIAKSARN